ncbi:MAG: PaaI family thioesterase [Actinomycetota bacterium]|nr:PaaI family thioesterase [Actinomycetota bacterium]
MTTDGYDPAGSPPVALTPDAINEMVRQSFPGAGNECAEIGTNVAVAKRVVSPAEIRPGGYVSGPAQFAIADAALWYLVFAVLGRVEPMALTSELSIRFLRPAVGDVLWARATLDSAARRTIVGTVHIWVDDRPHKPTSVGQGTYALPRPPAT